MAATDFTVSSSSNPYGCGLGHSGDDGCQAAEDGAREAAFQGTVLLTLRLVRRCHALLSCHACTDSEIQTLGKTKHFVVAVPAAFRQNL